MMNIGINIGVNTRVGAGLSYCGELVRVHDPDRFLLSMFAPADVREDLWALFAFNYEIAKTREVVSETQLGLIRLQWWRDAITGIYEKNEVLEHKILQVLAGAIKRHDLPRELFDTLIYAREFDLEDILPGNVEGVVNYADFTTTPLMKLAVKITGGDVEAEPVQPVAVNYALTGLLRAVPFYARQRRCYLPEDLLKEYGQRVDHLYEFKPVEGLPAVVDAVLGQFVVGVKGENRFLGKSNRMACIYFKQLKRVGCDVFCPKLSVGPAFKALRLFL